MTTKQRGRRARRPPLPGPAPRSVADMLPEPMTTSASLPVDGFAHLDISRSDRTGFPEVIYCEKKGRDQIVRIAAGLLAKTGLALATRCPRQFFPALRKAFPHGHFVREALAFRLGAPWPQRPGARAGIVSAGTTDIPVCEEAALILEALGIAVERIYDVGVAGIHRLFANDSRIRETRVLIVAAGMEGALPSVLGGLYPHPIIAVPTSNGYGTALAGFTPLLAMLTGCAPGVTVVNIDNGVGAAAAAFKMLNLMSPPDTVAPREPARCRS